MKKPTSFMLASGVLALATAAQAQGQTNRLYLNAGAGVVIQQSVNIKGGDKIEFDRGFRFDAGLGCRCAKYLSAEIETGVIYTGIDKIGGITVSSYGGGANLYQVPLVAGLVYRPSSQCPFKPYIGLGVGGVATVVDLKTPLGNVNDADFAFCYQCMAGVKYDLGKRVELGLAYKFLGTTDHRWADQGVTLDTQRTMSHSILATLTWSF
jgi:opacity protein-like surface antigen